MMNNLSSSRCTCWTIFDEIPGSDFTIHFRQEFWRHVVLVIFKTRLVMIKFHNFPHMTRSRAVGELTIISVFTVPGCDKRCNFLASNHSFLIIVILLTMIKKKQPEDKNKTLQTQEKTSFSLNQFTDKIQQMLLHVLLLILKTTNP